MRNGGLKVTTQEETFTVKVNALHLADVSGLRRPFDAVFLSVKSYDPVWATHFIEPRLTPSGVLISAQNGINAVTVKVAAEALTVAAALGVQVEQVGGISAATSLEAARGLGVENLRAAWVEHGKNVGAGRPSLLQDVLKGRRTEVDYLNGYVAQKGREVGVPTPVNQAIVGVMRRLEAGELTQGPENLRLL